MGCRSSGGGALTQHRDHGPCAHGGHAISGQALPAPVVVLADRLEEEGAVGQHRVARVRRRSDLGGKVALAQAPPTSLEEISYLAPCDGRRGVSAALTRNYHISAHLLEILRPGKHPEGWRVLDGRYKGGEEAGSAEPRARRLKT